MEMLRNAKYCDEHVCVCVCVLSMSVREGISGTTRAIFTQFFVHVAYGRGSVLLRRRCDTLCISGFFDDRHHVSSLQWAV